MARFVIAHSLLVNFCMLLVMGFPSSSGQTTPSKNVICNYVTTNELDIPDIDISICTHLVYWYAYLSTNDWAIHEFYGASVQLEQFMNLRLSNSSVKLLLAVSRFDSLVSATYENRQTFYTNAINFLRSWDFDGVDFLWIPYLKQEVVTIAQEFRVALTDEATSNGRGPLIFMLRVPGWTGAMELVEGVDFQPLGEAVDILDVTLMDGKYLDFYPFTYTVLASPLYGNGGYRGNVSASITNYLDAGVAPEKLHMAIDASAKLFALSDPQLTEVGAPVPAQKNPEVLSYGEVCERLLVEGYTAEFDPEGLVNFAYKGNQWFTYEDPASLQTKMNYVYDHNLGGVSVEFLHRDDYSGQFCNQGKYPLTLTLYSLA